MSLFSKDRDLTQPPDRVELTVDASSMGLKKSEVNLRLDAFLVHHLTWRSRSSTQKLIRDGYVLIDPSTPEHPAGSGRLEPERRPGRHLRHGSRVVVIIPEDLRLPELSAEVGELDVLYEDSELIAVDKPPGIPVHPSGRHLSDTLIQRLHAHVREKGEPMRGAPRLCHRLDRETSGIVLCAKDPESHRRIMTQFESRDVEKEYLAIVHGVPQWPEGDIDFALGPSRAARVRLKMAVQADGLPSRTGWKLLEAYAEHALLACRLYTGRQHQIRVHLAAIGHSIVGDKLYGETDDYFLRDADGVLDPTDLEELQLPRHALHNHRLVFEAPDGTRKIEVVSPMPGDMKEFLTRRSS